MRYAGYMPSVSIICSPQLVGEIARENGTDDHMMLVQSSLVTDENITHYILLVTSHAYTRNKNWMEYDRGNSFTFDSKQNGITFDSKAKGISIFSPQSYFIQFERKW